MKRLFVLWLVLVTAVPGIWGQGYKTYTDLRYGEKRAELKVDDPEQDRLLDIYVPATDKPEAGYPVVMFIHGGGFSSGAKDMRPTIQPIFEKLLDHGYAVVSINYILGRKRSGPAASDGGQRPPRDGQRPERGGQQVRGERPVRDGNEQERLQDRQRQQRPQGERRQSGTPDDPLLAPGPGSPMLMAGEDAVMALQWLDAHAAEYGLDMEFVALMGGSAGSATCICAAQYLHPSKPRVAAIVNCWGGFNALDSINDGSIPMLTYHGTNDSTIPIAQGYALQNRMELLGSTRSRMVVMEGRGHAEYRYIGQEKMEEIISFLDEVRGADAASLDSVQDVVVSARRVSSLNDNWQFKKGTMHVRGVFPDVTVPAPDTTVNLPHTWNQVDFMSNEAYYRGEGAYIKDLYVPASWKGKRVFVTFEGVGMEAWVEVNWKAVATHRGAYNAFTVDLTDHILYGQKNVITVTCSNRASQEIAPTGGDFNMYGGIYRDVWLTVTEEDTCINPLYYGSNGIFVNQKYLSDERASLCTEILLSTKSGYQDCDVELSVLDAEGKEVAHKVNPIINNDKATVNFAIDRPHRWNGMKDPYLYTLVVSLRRAGKEIDRVEDHFGLRDFYIDSDKGFFLNGEHLKLRGVSRHQDWAVIASALTRENHLKDLDIIQEMGANALRLAHYPQAHFMFEEADRRGFVVWEEIPFVGSYVSLPQFDENLRTQLREMILQNYNHPSICFWGLFNEIVGDFDSILADLNDIAHQLDPMRLTVAATYREGSFNFITDAIGWNKYFGWYIPKIDNFARFFDEWHAKNPDALISVSEYGAGASFNQHVARWREPERMNTRAPFHPQEMQTESHIRHIRMIAERDFLWGTYLWNMFDFASSIRAEGDTRNLNDKGLVSQDRTRRKDAYYAYKANWNKEEKTVWLCSKGFTQRDEDLTDIIVFTTAPSVKLFVNGKLAGTQKTDAYATVRWEDFQLQKGENHIEVRTAHGNDSAVWFVK